MHSIAMVNFKTFDLNLLRVFDAMIREGSTTRAGERLGLSQPAVSSALGRLRHALGDELFLRQGRGMVPTDYATRLSGPVRQTLDRLEGMLEGESFDPATSDAVFRFSGLDFFSEMLMPDLARKVLREAPGVRVQHLDLVPDTQVEMLDAHSLDLAIMPTVSLPDWVSTAPLFHSRFRVIARAGHPRIARAGIAPGGTLPLDLFCDLGHVLCSPDGKLRAMGDDALESVGRRRRVLMSMPFFSGVTRIVSESDLIALIPEQLADRVAERHGLVGYVAPIPLGAPLIRMYWHRRSAGSPAHRWFRECIASILTPLNPDDLPLPEA